MATMVSAMLVFGFWVIADTSLDMKELLNLHATEMWRGVFISHTQIKASFTK
jgi:hypothetical protein